MATAWNFYNVERFYDTKECYNTKECYTVRECYNVNFATAGNFYNARRFYTAKEGYIVTADITRVSSHFHTSFLGGRGVLRGSPCLSSGIHLLSLIRFSGLYGDLNIPPVISATLSGKGKRASYSPRKERRTSAVMREILPL